MKKMVLKIPQISTDVLFTKEIVCFLLIFVLIAIGLFLCFWGYQYFYTLCIMAIGACFGMIGVSIGNIMTQNAVVLLIFFVLFVLLGMTVWYVIAMFVHSILTKLKLFNRLKKREYVAGAVIGAVLVGSTVYIFIYRSVFIMVSVILILGILGTMYGKKKSKERIPFYTYEDIYERKPLSEGVQND